jgi:putative nucleotidyltransferase with HDIG domain
MKQTFPEIQEIEETKLREQTARAWIEAWKNGRFSHIDDAVVSPQMPQYRLRDHVRAVTRIAVAVAKVLEETHGLHVNKDYVIAGALLHDINKMIIYEKKGEAYGLADVAHRFPHGYLGALIAHKIGLPEDIEHMILSHTTKQISSPQTAEAIIVCYADCADFDALAHASNKTLLLERKS